MARDRSGYGHRFSEVIATIDRSYLESVDTHELFTAAMSGLFSKLDEHSSFMTGDDQNELESLLNQEFAGVGLELAIEEKSKALTIITPVAGSPAWRAGLTAGDRLIAIDGEATSTMTLHEAVARLRGRLGTPALLRVASLADPASREVTLVREVVITESVLGDRRRNDGSWDWSIEGDPEIALIRITSFGERTRAEIQLAIEAIQTWPSLKGIVLDLRGNPGGLLAATIEICDLFLDEGIIVSTRGRSDNSGALPLLDVRQATPGSVFEGVPIAVLIDGLTASAGEIVAACLQDNRRATVVGSRSFGKGTVQSILPLADGEGLIKLTTSEYVRPSNANIHRRTDDSDDVVWGVSPTRGAEIVPTGKTLEEMRVWRRARDIVPAFRPADTITTLQPPTAQAVEPQSASHLPQHIDPVLSFALETLRQP